MSVPFILKKIMEGIPVNNKYTRLNTEVARLCGVNAAVVAATLWDAQADKDAAIYIDGYPWVRASYKHITVWLPFLTVHMARTAARKLREEGIIKAGVYNESSFDHTYSYAFTDYGKALMRA